MFSKETGTSPTSGTQAGKGPAPQPSPGPAESVPPWKRGGPAEPKGVDPTAASAPTAKDDKKTIESLFET